MSVLCFVIHGIGTQDQDFSNALQEGIHKELTKLTTRRKNEGVNGWKSVEAADLVDFEIIYWANIETSEQNNLYRKICPDIFSKRHWFFSAIRVFSIRLLGDIFGYLGKSQLKIKKEVTRQIFDKIRTRFETSEPFSIILVGHSLGSVILHDIFTDLANHKYAGLESQLGNVSVFTMGSPISLFSLVRKNAEPSKFHKWVNFTNRFDPISYPMKALFKSVEDIRVLGGITKMPHGTYWHARKVHRRIALEIAEHYEQSLAITFKRNVLAGVPPNVFEPSQGKHVGHAKSTEFVDDFQEIPFSDLFENAKQIDICFVYGRTWIQRNTTYLLNALCKSDVTIRVCLLSPDAAALPGLAYHYNRMAEDKLKERINESVHDLIAIQNSSCAKTTQSGKLVIFLSNQVLMHSFYRFDSDIYLVNSPLASPKITQRSIPVSVIREDDNPSFFSWVVDDFNALLATVDDCKQVFDSNRRQS